MFHHVYLTGLADLKIWLFARSGISKISICLNIYLENRFIQWAFMQFCFEEIRKIDLLWEIVKEMESLL